MTSHTSTRAFVWVVAMVGTASAQTQSIDARWATALEELRNEPGDHTAFEERCIQALPSMMEAGPAAFLEWRSFARTLQDRRQLVALRIQPSLILQSMHDDAMQNGLAARRAESLPVLVMRLGEPDIATRFTAAWRAGELGADASQTIDPLLLMIREKNPALRYVASWALGRIGPRAIPGLIALLRDRRNVHDTVPAAALQALGFMGPRAREALPFLKTLLGESFLRDWVHGPHADRLPPEQVLLFQRIGAPAIPVLREAVRLWKGRRAVMAIRCLAAIGPEARAAIPDIRACANDPSTREAALEALERLESVPPPELLRYRLEQIERGGDGSELVRLVPTASEHDLLALVQALAHIHPRVRRCSFEALRTVTERLEPFSPRLVDLLSDARARPAAAWLLANADPSAMGTGLKSPDREIRLACVQILSRIEPPVHTATDALAALLDGDEETITFWAVHALGRMPSVQKTTLERLRALGTHPSMGIRVQAALAVRRLTSR